MKITMQKWPGSGRMHPALYDVLVEGKPIGVGPHSAGRVLKSPWGYLPVLDNYKPLPGAFKSRKACAEYVVSMACDMGVIERESARV